MTALSKKNILFSVPLPANDPGAPPLPRPTRQHPLLRALRGIKSGTLDLRLPDGTGRIYRGARPGARAQLCFRDWKSLDTLISHGDIGWGEDYMRGLWNTDDLPALMRFVAENKDALCAFSNGSAFHRLLCRARRGDKRGAVLR